MSADAKDPARSRYGPAYTSFLPPPPLLPSLSEMPPRKKRDIFKDWLSSFFPSKNPSRDGTGGFFENAQRFVVKDSNMAYVRGDQHNNINPVFNIQSDYTTVTQIMGLLSRHIIRGATHDSSARTPPPRCHPNTRVKLIGRVATWFEGQSLQELLLWIAGPAGVGKSAIVQTFAEYLAKSKSLGASVFISRLKRRNNPHGIFITIAYQLATRIEAYRNYIVERISLDPELLRRDMEAQFAAFIVEPFVERKIGAGGKRWGILLDGLDELRGEDAQCNIIHLISTFAREQHDTPLVWIIASRPESHLSRTFEDDEVSRSCWTEYIPIDSTEACEDVDRFLRSSFKVIQKNYQQSLPSDWPSETDFLKLTAAASGLFVYAQVVMEFIRDQHYGDPALRFEVLTSVISRSNAVPTNDNPFVHLDELYHEILSSIPPTHWPAAKLLLGFTIHKISGLRLNKFRTLRGMSLFFILGRNTIYASLTKCRSVLKIPDWEVAHKEYLTFFHASFSDYLKDSRRSGDFYVGDSDDIEGVVASKLVELWKKCSGDDIATALIESTWLQYCSNLGGEKPSSAVAVFHATLFYEMVYSITRFPDHVWNNPDAGLYELLLREVHMAKLCYYLLPEHLAAFVQYKWYRFLSDYIKLCRISQLQRLKFGHLDWRGMSPAKAYQGQTGRVPKEMSWILYRPRSSTELDAFVSELEGIQQSSPELEVVIFGVVPSGRVVTFVYKAENETLMSYAIPYPE